MKNAKRMLALAGITLAAGAMLGITPAQAAPASPQSSSTATAKSGPYNDWWGNQYVVGYYNSEWQCRKAGYWAERRNAWSDFSCYPAWGINNWGRVWVLQIEENDWRWDRWDGGWPRGWDYRPNYLSGPFDIGGYYNHPFNRYPDVGYRLPGGLGYHGNLYHPGKYGGDYGYPGTQLPDNGYPGTELPDNGYPGTELPDTPDYPAAETSVSVTGGINIT